VIQLLYQRIDFLRKWDGHGANSKDSYNFVTHLTILQWLSDLI
jgi:hypothetical protein